MKSRGIVITAILATVIVAGVCLAQAPATTAAPEVKAQTTCPVMGGAIDKKIYVDAEGKRIYLCCNGCVKAVKKEPAKYIKILEDKGVTLEKAPAPAAPAAGAAAPAPAPAPAK